METAIYDGICRCCASEGSFKDVNDTYHWMGEEEVYADMLKECFNVSLSLSAEQNGGICEVCITQLRNASNFKKQVLHTEEQFQKHLHMKIFKPVKIEVDTLENKHENDDNSSIEDGFSGTEIDMPIKSEDTPEEAKPKKRAAKTAKSKTKKSKSEKAETSNQRNHHKSDENSETEDEFKVTEFELTDDSKTKTSRQELVKHRNNIRVILSCSNATPIRRYSGIGYTCCYCSQQYRDPTDLKRHTLETHADVTQANFMTSMNMSEYVVKLDITDLRCKLCCKTIESLEQLTAHLIEDHKQQIFMDIKSHILAFRFENETLHCLVCSNSFTTFRMLLKHMHTHYRNFVCSVCDVGYVNRNSLTQHCVTHKTGTFACEYCKKIFTTHVGKKLHERNTHTHVHLLNKCGYCTETFKDYRKKEAHIIATHGVPVSRLKCQACDKEFTSRKLLATHVKRDHLLERPHECSWPDCDMTFFSTTGLKNHMVKHTGSRAYQCKVCHKCYGRKKTLNYHMRVHEDKRFKCEHCEQTFSQKSSWRVHLRNKHDEVVV